MEDQLPKLASYALTLEETIYKTKYQQSPHHDSTIKDMCADGEEHKLRKGRRKSGSKKHRAGKNKNQKRKYKPYYKMTREEREQADKRSEKRAKRNREYLQTCGVSLAPLNTTQFILEDNQKNTSLAKRFQDGNYSNGSSLSDDSNIAEDFDVLWDEKRFDDSTKDDLAETFLKLEDEVEELTRELEQRRDETTKIKIFQEELRRIEAENEMLTQMNAKLTKMLKDSPCRDSKVVGKLLEDITSYLASTMPCKDGKVECKPLEDDIPSADMGPAV